jgi:hypothetical protein
LFGHADRAPSKTFHWLYFPAGGSYCYSTSKLFAQHKAETNSENILAPFGTYLEKPKETFYGGFSALTVKTDGGGA